MTRSFLFALILLGAIAAPLYADSAEEKFLDKAEKVNDAVADTHVKLAKWCFKRGLNQDGRREIARALEVYPEHEKAMEALGYKYKRVDGEKQWVLDEDDAPPKEDHPDANPQDRLTYIRECEDVYKDIADEFVELAEYAQKLELEAHAKATYKVALKYDSTNETALKGAGWVKDALGEWVSPEEATEREQTRAALDDVPDAVTVDELPAWTSSVFGDAAAGMKFGGVTVIGSAGQHAETGKYAHAAVTLIHGLLGGDEADLRVVIAADEAQHKDYVSTRHPGIPGLAQDNWVLGREEVEVLLDEDDDLTMERVVYAVSVFEVRRRCGEVRHPWFEIGMATNLTRRLLGSVKTAEFAGDPAGPTEPGRWKRTLKMLIAEEKQPALGDVIVERDPDENEVILIHFFTRYLTRQRSAALGAFCRGYKADGDVEDAFQTAFAEDSGSLEKKFLDWFAGS